jgi:endonuclease YncB( thermonuclease family)
MIQEEIVNLFKNYDISTKEFTLNGLHTYARVVNVIDGDTIVCIIPLFDRYYKFSIRLAGIDTYEIKSKHPLLKNIALQAKYKLLNLVMDKNNDLIHFNHTSAQIISILKDNVYIVWLECLAFDKYGRVLANVKLREQDQLTFSTLLINANLAYKYNGIGRLNEDEQLQFLDK